ncbi:MAG: MFS transporter [Planctomycetota bacterium]
MIRRQLERVVDFEEGEFLPALLAGLYFFCLLFGYFMLRPLRESMGLEGGVDRLRWLYVGTLVSIIVINVIYGALVSKVERRRFIPIVYRFAIACLLVFLGLLLWRGDELGATVGSVFYVWLSAFNVFTLTVFWGFMADTFTLEQGKRLFGFIGLGGTLGALAGSTYAWQLAGLLGPVGLMLSAAVLLECATQLARRLGTLAARRSQEEAREEVEPVGGVSWSGITRVLQSPFLRGIAIYILVFTVMSTLLYFEKMRIVDETVEGLNKRTEVFAGIEVLAQSLTILVQVFLTARLMRWFGVGSLLAVVPAVSLVGFSWLTLAPSLLAVTVFEATRKACNYGVSKPARETLFTVVSRDEKYKAKGVIDTFVYRTGDSVGTLVDKPIHAAAVALAAVALPLAALGVGLAVWLGLAEKRRAEADDLESPDESPEPQLA